MIDDKQLISKLLASDLIDQKSLRAGLELAEKEDRTLYDVLIFEELVDEQFVVNIASDILNVPCVDLDASDVDIETAQLIPAKLATNSQSLPLELTEDDGVQVLKLAMTDPIDVMAMDEIASHTGVDIRPVLVGPADLQQAIEDLYQEIPEADDDAIELIDALDDDDVFELSDEALGEDDDSNSDRGFGGDAELINAPGGMVSDEDSWAAMFDEDDGQESEPKTGDTGVISQEMRDRPPTGVLEVMEEDLDDESSVGGNPAFSQHPAMMDGGTSGTQIGTPAELGDWELDEALENSGAPDLELESSGPNFGEADDDEPDQESEQDDDLSGTQIGSPVDPDEWELDDGFYDQDQEDEDKDESPFGPEVQDIDVDQNQTSIGLATRGDLDFQNLDVDDEYDDDEYDDDERDDDERDDDEPEEEQPEAQTPQPPEDDKEDKEDDPKQKKRVPSSIRDALKKASNRKKKSNPQTKSSASSSENKPADKDQKSASKKEEKAALGRIDVKKVAVPAFKGAVEKRSDRQKDSTDATKTVAVDAQDAAAAAAESEAPTTREISTSDLLNLAAESPGSDLKIPDDVDPTAFLQGLIQLLVARDLVSRQEMEALIDALSA